MDEILLLFVFFQFLFHCANVSKVFFKVVQYALCIHE